MPPSPSLARYRVLGLWLLVVIGWTLLYRDTFAIREANLDDVAFHREITRGNLEHYISDWGHQQGRYYGVFVFTPIWLLEVINPQWLFQLLRLGLVAVPLWLIGRLATKLTRSPEAEQLWWLLWIGLLQIPPTFYMLLSYPQMHCGLTLVLLAGHSFWRTLEPLERGGPAPGLPWRTGLLFFAGLQFHEAFLVLGALFVGLWFWAVPAAARRGAVTLLLPVGLGAVLYLAIYFSYYFSQRPTYEGTQAGASVTGLLVYLARYTASSLPGFELLIDRDPSHPALVAGAEVTRRLAAFDLWRLPWVLAVGAMTAWSLSVTKWALPRWRSVQLVVGSALLGLLFLVPAGVSQKYQVFAYRRLYPHAYNLVTVHFGLLAAVLTCLGLAAAWPPNSTTKRAFALSVGVACTILCLVSQATNQLALEQIRRIIAQAP